MQTHAWLAMGLALMWPAASQAQPVDPALDTLVKEALANNPDIRAAEEALAASREGPAQATALPDPMVSAVLTNEGWTPNLGEMPDSNLAVMATQDLPPPGSRSLRGRIAQRGIGVAEQQLARVRRSVDASVRRAYYSLAQSRALLALVEEQAEVWKQIEEVARARYGVGQGAQQDVLRVQVELTRVGQLRIEQQADGQVLLAEINRLRGRETGAPIETAPLVPVAGMAEPLELALSRLREASPELAAARIGIERARLAVDLARVQFRPGFSLQAAYMNRGGLDPMWQAGVGVTLPVRKGWRRAALAEAEARVRTAEAQLRATELALQLRTQERLVQLASARSLWTLYTEGIVPQGQMSVDAAMANYQAGKVPFLAVLEALATLYGDRSTQVRLQSGYARALASLEEASLQPTSDVTAGAGGGMGGGSGSSAAFGSAPMGGGAAAGAAQGNSGGSMSPMSGN